MDHSLTSDEVARPEPQAASREWWRWPLLLLIGVEFALLFAPTVAWLIDRWTLSVWHNAHGMFVPPITLWLAWTELKGRPDLPVEGSRWGFAVLLPALALHAIDAGMHTQLLSALALLLVVPGLCLLLLGTRRTRAIAFPLAFLLFALPIPLAFTEPIQIALRHLIAATTAALLPPVGVSVFREGTTLHTASGSISIADACAGFSTLYAASAVACLAAYTAASRRRGVFVLLAAAPIAIAANLTRVVALTLMVVHYGSSVLDTFLHPLSGMVTFALALPVLFWIGGPPGRDSVSSPPH